jgi:hypothetical protein
LNSGTAQSTSPHLLAKQSEERNTLSVLGGGNGFADLKKLGLYTRIVEIALCV